jgi:hypothetical protein
MDASGSNSLSRPRKSGEEEDSKKDIKPVRTLNRVPRACNACRKQKMRCEGADNPPCRRCRNTGLECLFEKPSREATLTGEAGLERIRSLENHVAEIKHHQIAISGTLNEICAFMRGGGVFQPRSPQGVTSYSQSPGMQSMATPPASTPTMMHASSDTVYRTHRGQVPKLEYPGNTQPLEFQSPTSPQGPSQHSAVLPPFSSIQTPRYPSHSTDSQRPMPRFHNAPPPGSKRAAPANNPSAHSSDVEEDGEGLPSSGLVAPWEVLRGLADVAVEQAAKVSVSPS